MIKLRVHDRHLPFFSMVYSFYTGIIYHRLLYCTRSYPIEAFFVYHPDLFLSAM